MLNGQVGKIVAKMTVTIGMLAVGKEVAAALIWTEMATVGIKVEVVVTAV